MALQDSSPSATRPIKPFIPQKKEKFFGSKTFNDIVLNGIVTAGVINNVEEQTERMAYYVAMADKALEGDIKPLETMLMTQACTLDLLFNKFVRIARNCEYLNGTEAYFKMAAKAQKQCRQTLLALREVQHPRKTTFVNQQNNALNQQVNNNSTEKDFQKNSANELLTEMQHETMDTGRTAEASPAHP